MRATAAILVHVLGDIDEVREIGKCAHYVESAGDRQWVEQCFELRAQPRCFIGTRATESNRGLADRLDACKSAVARLIAQHVAQDAAQQTCIFLEREIFVGRGVHECEYATGHVRGFVAHANVRWHKPED